MGLVFFMINFIFIIIMVLIGVAFVTLLERKILGYIQVRKGPNKVSFGGLLQPFADAVKLFTKGLSYPYYMNFVVYYLSPGIMLFVMLVSWLIYPMISGTYDFMLGVLFFFCCTSFSVYTLFGAGWSSNSKYALLGALRGIAQTISYEVSLALILFSGVIVILSYDLVQFIYFQEEVWFCFIMIPLLVVWFISSLAETNRTPFDFAEGESELVSGFNVEYSGGSFALLFMAEYGSIMFMSFLGGVLFFGGAISGLLVGLGLICFFIWVRGALPRFRYDKLMYLAWKIFLPLALNYNIFFFGFVFLLCN